MDGTTRAPTHLWIVGVLATLWNAFGAYDYIMTQTRNEAYLANFSAEARAYFESFPALMEAAWACGIWGAVAGSLLLLARSRYAVWAFAISLAGLLVSTIYQFTMATPPPEMREPAMMAMMGLIWIVAIVLFLYARRMQARGVLR